MRKNLILIFFVLLIVFLISCKNSVVETQVQVYGACDIAKKKIDSAARLEGVIKADWNKESKLLTIKYDSTKVSIDAILKNVAMAGFDNERYFADDYAYEELPDSCKYERKSE